jgi:hypothetical protein
MPMSTSMSNSIQRSDNPYTPWGNCQLCFSVYIYPPRDPNNPYQTVDRDGVPADPYYVKDSCTSWSNSAMWRRTIKALCHGGVSLTKAVRKKNPYYQEIYDHINRQYPAPNVSLFPDNNDES